MRILVVKTSSLGDVIHTLPALTDAKKALGQVSFDWVVERPFQEIPLWHNAVGEVIVSDLRRWRKAPLKNTRAVLAFRKCLKAKQYDVVIDAQGLIKSALISTMTNGPRYGLDKNSAREPLSAHAYHNKIPIQKGQHAIERTRQLFAQSLGYGIQDPSIDYGLHFKWSKNAQKADKPYVVLMPGTTWFTKLYPTEQWRQLRILAVQQGFQVKLTAGNAEENEMAHEIAKGCDKTEVLPKQSLTALASVLCHASGIISVDSGLSHLSAACGVPCVTLYGSTDPGLTGAKGDFQTHLMADYSCAPCLKRRCVVNEDKYAPPPCWATLKADRVWNTLKLMMDEGKEVSSIQVKLNDSAHFPL